MTTAIKFSIFILLTFLYCAIGPFARAQSTSPPSILNNKQAYDLTQRALNHIYNVDTERSEPLIDQIDGLLPNYPAVPLLKALSMRSANYPLEPGSAAFGQMKEYLYRVIDQSEEILDKDDDHAEVNFFMLSAHGLLALYENEDGNTFKAVGQAKNAYSYLKNGFDLVEVYPDFYFSTGLYNYYREKYPELRPAYRPFMWFFRSGDTALGLKQLDTAVRKSLFLGAESADFLIQIYLFYEDRPGLALPYARRLVNDYPDNLYFTVNYVHAALGAGKFAGVDTYVQRLISSDKRYFQVVGNLFRGMLLEKRDRRWDEAEAAYLQSLQRNIGIKGEEAKNYRSYAYVGLARIAAHEKKAAQAKRLYEQALEAAQYPPVKQEAEAYLKGR
ncbi:MAG: tetratricopeptide repeat protein [Tunicatimonas sp.]